ncbi:hypothetical protein HF521_009390 [Silurus meridionalis]|uniref:Neuroblast differentiation-associated protein AHNAK-like n=1 Tax=Silurus meridionalis TaxID=175797 RepID=A0A8T0BU04_SILME|nr:hypothetical protein HF521_009390 [Silurus meridionalis]
MKTKKHGDKKGHEKKPKKPKISIEGFDITKPDIQSPIISTEIPKERSFKMDMEETKIHEKHKFKTPKVEEVDNISVPVQESKILEDNMDNRNLPQKTETKFGKTKFKIPTLTIPEFGTELPREEYISAVDVQGKAAEKTLLDHKLKVSAEPVLFDTDGTDENKDGQYGGVHDTEPEEQGKKFKLPKFEISFPEVKTPKIICTSKKDNDSSVSEENGEVPVVHSPKTGPPDSEDIVRIDQPEVGSAITEVKFKRSGFSFPRFGISKTEYIAPEADVNVTNVNIALPDGQREMDDPNKNVAVSVKDGKQKDATKFVSPTKFKIPSIKFPSFGTKVPKAEMAGPDVNVDVKGPEISVPDAEIKLTAEPALVNIKGPDADIESKSLSREKKDLDIHIEEQGSKFKLPKFGISLPEMKGPKIDTISDQEIDISLPKTNIQVNLPDFEVEAGTTEVKADFLVDLDKVHIAKTARKISDVDVDVKGPEISLPDVEMKLSADPVTVDIKGPDADKEFKLLSVEIQDQDFQVKEQGSKFKLPKFGISLPEVKGPKIDVSSDKAEIDISVPKASLDVHPPDFELQGVTAEIKGDLPEVDSKDIEMKIKTPGFSFPSIEFSKSDVKSPEVDVSLPKVDVSLPETRMKIEHPTTDVTMSVEDAELKGRSKFGSPTKFKMPSFTLPKFGAKGPKATVHVSDVNVEEISLPDAELKLSVDPVTVDIKGPDADKEIQSISMEIEDQDFQVKEQGSKFKLPKFGISLPEVKGPKIDVSLDKEEIAISAPKASIDVHPPDVEVQGVTAEISADLPEVDSKDIEMKMKTPGFSFPSIGFSKSDIKSPEVDVSLPKVDVSLPEGRIEIERPTTDVTMSVEDAELKGRSKFGSPTKFKLPSFTLPKFGTKGRKASVEVADVDVDVKGPEISLPDAGMKLSAEPVTVDIKGLDADKEVKSLSVEIKDQDFQVKEQGSKFKLPKFGISLPEVKGPKIDVSSDKAEIDISVPEASLDVHPPDVEVQGVTAEIKVDLPKVDSKDIEMKTKTPGFSFPSIGFSKSDIKSPEVDVSLPKVDVSLPEGRIEIERPTTDVTMSVEDAELKGRSKFGSPTKFKMPSFTLPKFGSKGPKATVNVSDVDVDVKGPEISLQDAEIKLSADPVTVDIKGPDTDKEMKSLSVEIQDQDFHVREQGSKFKLPKFGFSLPEVKGPKIDVSSDKADIDISVPKPTLDVHPPDVEVQGVTAEIRADLPEVDSKDIEMKMKTPGFSFPSIGFSKSDIKSPEVDVSLPKVDVSLPEGRIEIERPTTDVTMSVEDAELKGRSKFGSPTKFKMPSFTLPKFGTKGPKATVNVSDVDVDVKGPEISLPDAELKLSADPVTVDIKGPDADKEIKSLSVEIKDQDFQVKEQGSKFKLPKFGFSLPEVKGPKIDVSSDKAEIDISVPNASFDVHPPDVEVQGVTAEIKADLPEVDSKHIEMKMKTPGISFPSIGFSKSDVKSPEVDVNLPKVDVSLPEGKFEIERPTTDVTMSVEDAELKGRSKFGSPTKFKLPSFTLPKFGSKGPKATVNVSDVDVDVKGPEISLPDAEIKLSADPVTVDFKGPDADKEIKSLSVEIKDQDFQVKEQGSKFKLPKFGFSLPEVKGTNIDVSTDKAKIDISIPEARLDVHPPDVEVQGVTAEIRADLPEVDSRDIEMKMKTPGFSFPSIGFSKSDVKSPEVALSLPNVDVSLPEGRIEIERPTTDVKISIEDAEQQNWSTSGSPTKFKLPSIDFPKFGTKGPKVAVNAADIDVDVKGPEISLPDSKMKLSVKPVTVDIEGPGADKEIKLASTEIKDQDFQVKEQGSKFKLPKFGFSGPELKGPKIDVSLEKKEMDISVQKAKVEVHPPEVKVQGITAEIKTDLPEVDSKDIEMEMKTPGFSFPRIVFNKSDVTSPDVDVSLPNVDVSLHEGSMEMEQPSTDVRMSVEDAEHKGRSKFGSSTKFKLPSINFPKFGTKGPKATLDVSDVNLDVKGPKIGLSDADIKLSAQPITMDVKEPGTDKEVKSLNMEIKGQDFQVKEQGSKFKLPKFEISVPEMKGQKIDVSSDKAEMYISIPKAKAEVHPHDVELQDVMVEIKGDLPEVDSNDIEVKMKTPGFSFPRIGFSKSEAKATKVDPGLQNVDMPLPEASTEMKRPDTDVTISVEDAEHKGRSKFGSPTKFKMPSINFPKFGTKGPKATVEVSDVDVDVKGPEISLPDAELKLPAEPLLVVIKGPDADKGIKSPSKEVKDQEVKEQESKFKLPKFGISVLEVKGPKVDVSSDKAEIKISVPKAKAELYPPDIEVQGVTTEFQADLDSKDIEVKMKRPGLSFSDTKAPAGDEVLIPKLDSKVGKCEDDDTFVSDNALDVFKQKYTQEVKTSSKFILPSLGDVFSGFEVEFNVPTFEEIEEAKKISEVEKQNQPQPEDSDWFRFHKFSSSTKTSIDNENVASKFPRKSEQSPQSGINENEYKKSFTRETDEETVSPTLSLSSSDAFADVSSALTTEQIGLSITSPTKVKVKYSEPTVNTEVSDIHGDIITSTARTELISMEPYQPEKVNIPFSSETSSSSVDTLKQISGHLVVSNVQSVSKTQHATILTKLDTQNTQTLPSGKVTDSLLLAEETVMRKGHTIVEKHVVKEIFGDDKEKIFVTQRIQVFEGDSSEPISDDTASSIQRLRDTVHTEKIRFFEGAESSNTILMSTETLLRHADSSTDENEGQ